MVAEVEGVVEGVVVEGVVVLMVEVALPVDVVGEEGAVLMVAEEVAVLMVVEEVAVLVVEGVGHLIDKAWQHLAQVCLMIMWWNYSVVTSKKCCALIGT